MVNRGGRPKLNPKSRGVFLSALMLLVWITGCTFETPVDGSIPEGEYLLNIYFREIYDKLGGEAILGRPISPLITRGQVLFQYVEGGLLRWDSADADAMFFQLYPLGIELGYQEPPVPPPSSSALKYLNGHIIPPEFASFYERMKGALFVGMPLTEARYNPTRKRYEQFFENVGLYRLEGDQFNDVKLLNYGSTFCGKDCSNPINKSGEIDIQPKQDSPFRNYMSHLPQSITGFPLTEAYPAPDGKLEQIYENVVVAANPADLSKVSLRQLPQILEPIQVSLEVPNGDPNFHFFPVEGDRGFNIPNDIWVYWQQHGGLEISGPPVTGFVNGLLQRPHQCFLNLCIMRDPNMPEGHQVRMEPLGYLYDSWLGHTANQETENPNLDDQKIIVNTWELYPALETGDIQEIHTSALQGDTPLVGVELVLEFTLPDGNKQQMIFPATDANGQAYLTLQPIDARTYAIVPYQVCLLWVNQEHYCHEDSFIIINNVD